MTIFNATIIGIATGDFLIGVLQNKMVQVPEESSQFKKTVRCCFSGIVEYLHLRGQGPFVAVLTMRINVV